MSDEKKIKLFKVVKELNIGLRTAVDFLKEQGYNLAANPNTLISQSMHKVLTEKYSKLNDNEASKNNKNALSIDQELISEITIPEKQVKETNSNLTNTDNKKVVFRASKIPPAQLKVVDKVDLSVFAKRTPKTEKHHKKTEDVVKKEIVDNTDRKNLENIKTKAEYTNPANTEVKVIRAKAEHLAGPKVVGKINLPTEERAASKASIYKKRKRKRKALPQEGNTPTHTTHTNTTTEAKTKDKPETKFGFENKYAPKKQKKTSTSTDTKSKNTHGSKPYHNTQPATSQSKKLATRAKIRREKREAISQALQDKLEEDKLREQTLQLTEFVTANDLAKLMNISVSEILSACMQLGILVSINQRLDSDIINIITEEVGYDVEYVSAELMQEAEIQEDKDEELETRSPIITVMGHVDHGKTSLLDYVRKTNVIAGESGGITQHIAAYEVTLANGKKVTFLDTPGHEAFTAMRARGAQVTDLAIIVIAADDAVMPQTIEAINHVQAANVPIVFAFNKIDKDGANSDKIREQLSNMDILVEEWGGKYQTQEISAKTGLNVDKLLDKILLEADILDLKANPNRRGDGIVLEASLDKGRGIVTTLLIQGGTIKLGDPILAGQYSGKVKALFNERWQKVTSAGPSKPVILLGMNGIPTAGDKVVVMKSEHEARDIANKRFQLQREQGLRAQKHISLDQLNKKLNDSQFKELKFIIKADVDGSLEALADSLFKLSNEQIKIVIIHKSIGEITESDVLLAAASDAIIIGFRVKSNPHAKIAAEREQIDMHLYSIIYKAIEEVQDAMKGLIEPKIERKVIAEAEVKEIFKINKVGVIAGSHILNGKIIRNHRVQVKRDDEIIATTTVKSLKRFKDDVKEVITGQECGIILKEFDDLMPGDIIESFEEVKIK
ncbi:MAG: translation initiation factor IF-2 [Solitalea-like symbiont of Acarus siro]